MKTFIFSLVITITISFLYTGLSFAVCVEGPPDTFTCNTDPPNPDPDGVQANTPGAKTVIVQPGAGIDTTLIPAPDNDGIETESQDDDITVTDGSVIGQDNAITTRSGNDTVTITDSDIASTTAPGIELGNGNDEIHILRSVVTTTSDNIINTGSGQDVVDIRDSELIVLNEAVGFSLDRAVNTSSGNDQVFIENSLLRGACGPDADPETIFLGDDDDTLTLGTGSVLKCLISGEDIVDGLIDCGEGFDTIVFSMDVPEETLALFSSEIAKATLPDGSVTINGLTYNWERCEALVNQLNGVRVVRPIPTLSEWGLIAMAGVLGIVALLAIRRRNVTA